jgi:2-amino-4-hydroxy-6-hydroxymethyldihydropteridine diphosphokinase
MGRIRRSHWESRIIDLDILTYGGEIIEEANLTVPHPFMHLRRFVLVPMVELAPDLVHPVIGLPMRELLEKIPGDGQIVTPVE